MELLTDLWHFALFDKYTCKCKNLSVRRFKLHMNWNPPLNPTLYYTPYKEKNNNVSFLLILITKIITLMSR